MSVSQMASVSFLAYLPNCDSVTPAPIAAVAETPPVTVFMVLSTCREVASVSIYVSAIQDADSRSWHRTKLDV